MKTEKKAAEEAKPKTEKKAAEKNATISVEKVNPKDPIKPKVMIGKTVSGNQRVNFQSNGSNPKLGEKVHKIAASTAQDFVNKGWGHVVE